MDEKKIREGFLFYPVPPSPSSYFSSLLKPFSKNIQSYPSNKSWSRKRFMLFAKSSQGLQRLEEGKVVGSSGQKRIMIPLNDCLKIWSPSPSLIEINTRSGEEYLLKVDGREEELTGWLLSLQQVAFGFMTEQEENQLYEDFVRADSLFRVQVIASPVKTLKDFHELYLRLTERSIELLSPSSIVPVFTWNFRDIRRYGSSPETFTLEAGRRCSSGPGIFSFATPKGTQFFSLLSTNLRQLMEREQFSSRPNLDIADQMSSKPLKPPRRKRDDDCDDISLTPPPSPSRANNLVMTSSTSDDENYSPDYENILSLTTSIPPTQHYLQNDAEYAVVLKEKPKTNHEQLIE